MKTLSCRILNHGKEYELRLGKVYAISRSMSGKEVIGIFIKTSKKGFNFLNIKNASCMFIRPLFQTNSAQKNVGRKQVVFQINVPDHIDSIKELNQQEIKKIKTFGDGLYFNSSNTPLSEVEKRLREEEKELQRLRKFESETISNPLEGMEI